MLNVHLNESDIEVAFDRGRLAAGRRSAPICELELELKRGRASDLAALARRLQKEMPLAFEPRAKTERGYELLRNAMDAPVHAAPITLQPGRSAGAAFAQIGLACVHHFAANDRAVLARQSEGVHQMRVGLRRLRAAISLFGAMLQGREVEDIKQALKWLTAELAPARDLDVLAKEAIAPLREAAVDKPEIALLEQGVRNERSRGFVRARDAVSSPQFREIVLHVALWLIGGEWSRAQSGAAADLRERPVAPLATRILARRAKKIIKKAKRLNELDAVHRHKLRIAVKKLRYGCAFFESLFDHPKRRRRYGKILKKLQGTLGKLNDIRVHDEKARRLAHRKGREPAQSKKAYAMGVLTGREQRLADGLVLAAQKSGRRLSRTPTFW
jgi:inorganic triphosphatase YgiF